MEATILENMVTPLLAEEEGYITFLEIWEITRLLPQIEFLPTAAIPFLEQLLSHPRLTLGGYQLLDVTLERLYQKIRDEWLLGKTAVGYEHNGATIRIKNDQRLALLLSEEGDGSQQWQPPEVYGPLRLDYCHHFSSTGNPNQGFLRAELIPQGCGMAQIKANFMGLGLARKAQKPFTLNILVEERLIPRLELDLDNSK